MIDWTQTPLASKRKYANAFDREHGSLLVSEKRLKYKLQLTTEGSQKV